MSSEVLISIISVISASIVAVISIVVSYKQQRKVLKFQKYFEKQYEILSFVYGGICDITMKIVHIKVLSENEGKETQRYREAEEELRNIWYDLQIYIRRNELFLDEKLFEKFDGFLMEATAPTKYRKCKNIEEHLDFLLFIQSDIKKSIREIIHKI